MGCHNFFAHGLESLRAAGVVAHIASGASHAPELFDKEIADALLGASTRGV